MKTYDSLMEQLKFRENFCEDTLGKAEQQKRNSYGLPRKLICAACICLCAVILMGTALAVSPQLRALLIPNFTVERVEAPELPTEPNQVLEKDFSLIRASYYKLDGSISAHSGMGSVIPVEKNGKLKFYTVGEVGNLELAKAPKIIQKELSYKNKTWSLDLRIYGGDIPTVVSDGIIYPLPAHMPLTLGRVENNVWLPVSVDTQTLELGDPMGRVNFIPEADAIYSYVNYNAGSSTLLIRSQLDTGENRYRYYYGNAETGEVLCIGEGSADQYVLRGGKIYVYENGILSVLDEVCTATPLFGGNICTFDGSDFACCKEGKDLWVLDLRHGEEYYLENCAENYPEPCVISNPGSKMFALSDFRLTVEGGLDTASVSLVDPTDGKMYTLERDPNMKEKMSGWLDKENFFIAGTIDGEWYICLYRIS